MQLVTLHLRSVCDAFYVLILGYAVDFDFKTAWFYVNNITWVGGCVGLVFLGF